MIDAKRIEYNIVQGDYEQYESDDVVEDVGSPLLLDLVDVQSADDEE